MTRLLQPVLFVLLLAGSAALAQGVTLPEHHYIELDNGITFILHEKNDVPLIGMTAVVAGGAVADPDDKAGVASLLANMLEKGAGDRDAAEFAEAVDASGGSLSASASLESITLSGEFLAHDAELAIELLVDMLTAPALDAGEFRMLRDRKIGEIRATKDSGPGRLLNVYGAAWLFGDHPYGTPVSGDETSLARISHRDLLSYYADFVGADRTIISIVGDFDAAQMIDALSEAFRGWRPAVLPLPEIEVPLPEEGRRVLLVDKPGTTQTYFWFGNLGTNMRYPQRAELDIANTLFGGRFGSLLVDELRVKTGLTYAAWSALLRLSESGVAAVVSFTKTDSTIPAIDLALELLTRLHDEGFDDERIQSGKNYILGQFPPKLETAAQLAAQLAELEAFGLDESYINSYGAAVAGASGEDIQSVINSVYPTADNLVFVIIGDAELIRDDIARYGPVTELSITEPRFRP